MRGLSVAVLGWLLYEGSSATDSPGEQLTILVTTTETVCPFASSVPLTPASSYPAPSSSDTSTLTSTSTLTIYITETRTRPDGNTTTLTEALPVTGTPASSFPYTGTPASSLPYSGGGGGGGVPYGVPYSSISASSSNVTTFTDSDPLATSSLQNLTTPTSLGIRPNLTTPLPASVLTSSRNGSYGSYGGQVPPTPPATTVLPDPLSPTTSGAPVFTAGARRAAGGVDVAAAAVAALIALL